jgi:secondary thiamine-phosphate synthase enzyme
MKQRHGTIVVETRGPGFTDVTHEVRDAVLEAGIRDGGCTLLLLHTSASLLIQENYDPSVRRDLDAFFRRLAPEDPERWEHDAEGPDDMPAHVKAALTSPSLSLPVQGGVLRLGRWQGVFLWEHRRRPHRREIAVHVWGE